MNVAILGARERPWTEEDRVQVESIITDLYNDHGARLVVVSVGCDEGVGKHAMEFCNQAHVKFAEARIKFQGVEFPRQFFAQIFKARNLSLLNVCDMFHIFCGPNPRGLIQEVIEPAKERVGPERVRVYPYTPS